MWVVQRWCDYALILTVRRQFMVTGRMLSNEPYIVTNPVRAAAQPHLREPHIKRRPRAQPHIVLITVSKHAGRDRQSTQEGFKESRVQGHQVRPEKEEAQEGDVRHLCLQGSEAGPPRHRHLLQGDGHHELVC